MNFSSLILALAMLTVAPNVMANMEQLSGVWWVVNSPVVSEFSRLDADRVLERHCDAEHYFTYGNCLERGEHRTYRRTLQAGQWCSEPQCWYLLSLSKREESVMYIKADAMNTMPGVGYALTARRLKPGQWPMRL